LFAFSSNHGISDISLLILIKALLAAGIVCVVLLDAKAVSTIFLLCFALFCNCVIIVGLSHFTPLSISHLPTSSLFHFPISSVHSSIKAFLTFVSFAELRSPDNSKLGAIFCNHCFASDNHLPITGKAPPTIPHNANSHGLAILCSDCGINTAVSTTH
jgi:hypothetical protein